MMEREGRAELRDMFFTACLQDMIHHGQGIEKHAAALINEKGFEDGLKKNRTKREAVRRRGDEKKKIYPR